MALNTTGVTRDELAVKSREDFWKEKDRFVDIKEIRHDKNG